MSPEIRLMTQLRRRGWLVVLKCIPRTAPGWIAEGSRSEFDAPCPDRVISRNPWCAEATYMGRDVIHAGNPWATGKNPRAVLFQVYQIANQLRADCRRRSRARKNSPCTPIPQRLSRKTN